MTATREDAERDSVRVPTTLQEYCVTAKPATDNAVDVDFYDDDYVDDMDDEEEMYEDDDDDSGNEES